MLPCRPLCHHEHAKTLQLALVLEGRLPQLAALLAHKPDGPGSPRLGALFLALPPLPLAGRVALPSALVDSDYLEIRLASPSASPMPSSSWLQEKEVAPQQGSQAKAAAAAEARSGLSSKEWEARRLGVALARLLKDVAPPGAETGLDTLR